MNQFAFLGDLAVVLGAAAVTTVLFQRLRLPTVLGYLLAGVAVGPYVPPRLVSDENTIRLLSELGVILLMFSIGLHFNLRRLARLAPTAGLTCLAEVSLMLALGVAAGQLLGFTPVASLFVGGVLAISSTMVITKVFEEVEVEGPVRDLVFGILIFEDLVAVILIAVLTGVGSGAGLESGALMATVARLAVVLVLFLVVGLVTIPRVTRLVASLRRDETLLVTSIGISFGLAWLAHAAGYSVALGAFIAGMLVAESGVSRLVEDQVRPVRDMFAAIFFVAVGMQLDPVALIANWWEVLLLGGLVVGGKLAGVTVGAFLTGHGVRNAAMAGLSLAQIGEFSFIIAGVGVQLGAAPPLLYTLAVAVSAATAFTSPGFIRRASSLAQWLDRKLPAPLQTFATLYGSWIELLRTAPRNLTPWQRIRYSIRLLLLDALAILLVLVAAGLVTRRLDVLRVPLAVASRPVATLLLVLLTLAVLTPFVLGLIGVARRIGLELAEVALPPVVRRADNAYAPRRLLAVTLQILALFMVGILLAALSQPFLPSGGGLAVGVGFLGLLLIAGFGFWRGVTDLQGHVMAGAQVVIAALAKKAALEPSTFGTVRQLLPGLGDMEPVLVQEGSAAAGQTLGELNLRGRTGATVVAVLHGDERITYPEAETRIAPGDRLALTGTHDAIEQARALFEAK